MATGRKPQLSVLAGENNHLTKKEKKQRARNEPTGCKARLKPPASLSEGARAEWKRIVKLYRQLDAEVINDLDINTLAFYCENVAVMQKAEEELKTQPLVVTVDADKGTTKPNPLIKIMNDAGLNIVKAAEQLCLSPVGRARIGKAGAKADKRSEMEKYLERSRLTN